MTVEVKTAYGLTMYLLSDYLGRNTPEPQLRTMRDGHLLERPMSSWIRAQQIGKGQQPALELDRLAESCGGSR